MKKLILAIVCICPLLSFGQSDSYKEKLTDLFHLNGSKKTFDMVVKQMTKQMKSTQPDIPSEFWDDLEKEFLSSSINDLVDLVAPVYERHITETELDDILVFFRSPAGKKLGEKTPVISQETMMAGREWGLKISQKIASKMEDYKAGN